MGNSEELVGITASLFIIAVFGSLLVVFFFLIFQEIKNEKAKNGLVSRKAMNSLLLEAKCLHATSHIYKDSVSHQDIEMLSKYITVAEEADADLDEFSVIYHHLEKHITTIRQKISTL